MILAVLDVSLGGMTPTPGPKSLYFAVDSADTVHARARGSHAPRRTRSTVSQLPT